MHHDRTSDLMITQATPPPPQKRRRTPKITNVNEVLARNSTDRRVRRRFRRRMAEQLQEARQSKLAHRESGERKHRPWEKDDLVTSGSGMRKLSESKSFLRIQAAAHGLQGGRKTMQDENLTCIEFDVEGYHMPGPWSLAAVFDGHGGCRAATYLKGCFLETLRKEMRSSEREAKIGDIIRRTFLRIDHKLCGSHQYGRCGSCAIVCLVHHPTREAWIANAGDSRAILCRDGKALRLSTTHKPTNPSERQRIKRAGGFVFARRVDGELAVSRAFGDTQFKKNGVVTARPDVKKVDIRGGDDYMVLASDGLFDVMEDSEVVEYVSTHLTGCSKGDVQGVTSNASMRLCEHAVSDLHARDNVTAILLRFKLQNKNSSNTSLSTIISQPETYPIDHQNNRETEQAEGNLEFHPRLSTDNIAAPILKSSEIEL